METRGLVAFFDILGYQNIIDNNEIGTVSKLISGTLNKMPDMTRESIRADLALLLKPDLAVALIPKQLETRLVSDSLLVSLPLPPDEDPAPAAILGWMFFIYVNRLVREMFTAGLPVRGAVDIGEFFLDGQCFAGKPIIDCYRIAQALELSGAVLTDDAYAALKRFATTLKIKESQLAVLGLEYSVPMKHSPDGHKFLLDWWFPTGGPQDVRQAVFEAFCGHKKDVVEQVLRKLENTELTIRAFIHRRRAGASEH